MNLCLYEFMMQFVSRCFGGGGSSLAPYTRSNSIPFDEICNKMQLYLGALEAEAVASLHPPDPTPSF